MPLRPRNHPPNIPELADQLVEDYLQADEGQGSLDITSTLASWHETQKFHGDEFRDDDWGALVQELVRRIVDEDMPGRLRPITQADIRRVYGPD